VTRRRASLLTLFARDRHARGRDRGPRQLRLHWQLLPGATILFGDDVAVFHVREHDKGRAGRREGRNGCRESSRTERSVNKLTPPLTHGKGLPLSVVASSRQTIFAVLLELPHIAGAQPGKIPRQLWARDAADSTSSCASWLPPCGGRQDAGDRVGYEACELRRAIHGRCFRWQRSPDEVAPDTSWCAGLRMRGRQALTSNVHFRLGSFTAVWERLLR